MNFIALFVVALALTWYQASAPSTTTSPYNYCEYIPNQCWLSNDTNCVNAYFPNSSYWGTLSTTINGYTCQAWSTQSPHSQDFTFNSSGNYCRGTDAFTPWCYTTDPDVRWDLCFKGADSCGRKYKYDSCFPAYSFLQLYHVFFNDINTKIFNSPKLIISKLRVYYLLQILLDTIYQIVRQRIWG